MRQSMDSQLAGGATLRVNIADGFETIMGIPRPYTVTRTLVNGWLAGAAASSPGPTVHVGLIVDDRDSPSKEPNADRFADWFYLEEMQAPGDSYEWAAGSYSLWGRGNFFTRELLSQRKIQPMEQLPYLVVFNSAGTSIIIKIYVNMLVKFA